MAVVRYMVDDAEANATFYCDLLGFTVEQWLGPIVIVARDDLRLWLAGPGTSASRPMPDNQTPKPGGWNRIVIEVDDRDTVAAALRASGSTFRNDIISGPGGRQILAEDPSGNLIELFEARRS